MHVRRALMGDERDPTFALRFAVLDRSVPSFLPRLTSLQSVRSAWVRSGSKWRKRPIAANMAFGVHND